MGDIMLCLQGAKWFTVVDMKQRFHLVRMAVEGRHKTAFQTFVGSLEWRVMPFGLEDAPGACQSIMNSTSSDLLARGVSVHMDDVVL